MLDATRLRTPCLFDKIVSADEAATLITDGMNVGVSGYPKKTTLALAKAIKAGKKCRINIWSGASVGPEIEETLAEVGGISGRMPYYAASNKTLSRQINTGSVTYIDQHLSHFAQQIDYFTAMLMLQSLKPLLLMQTAALFSVLVSATRLCL